MGLKTFGRYHVVTREEIKKAQVLLKTFEKSLESLILGLDMSLGKETRCKYIKIKKEEV